MVNNYKFGDVFNYSDWENFLLEIETENNIPNFKKVLITTYWKQRLRTIRPYFLNVGEIKQFIKDFVNQNLQKFKYLVELISTDFLSLEISTSVSGENIDYNIDYFGGSGEVGKDKNTLLNTNKTIDNRNKLMDFVSTDKNLLINEMFNLFLETYEVIDYD